MLSYLILFAFIALVIYYAYIFYGIIKKFIKKKIAEKAAKSEIKKEVSEASYDENQTHDV